MNKSINFSNWSDKDMHKQAKLFIDNYSKQLGREIPFEQPEMSDTASPFSKGKQRPDLQKFEDAVKDELEKNSN